MSFSGELLRSLLIVLWKFDHFLRISAWIRGSHSKPRRSNLVPKSHWTSPNIDKTVRIDCFRFSLVQRKTSMERIWGVLIIVNTFKFVNSVPQTLIHRVTTQHLTQFLALSLNSGRTLNSISCSCLPILFHKTLHAFNWLALLFGTTPLMFNEFGLVYLSNSFNLVKSHLGFAKRTSGILE